MAGTAHAKNNGGLLYNILRDVSDIGADYVYHDEICINFVSSKSNSMSEF